MIKSEQPVQNLKSHWPTVFGNPFQNYGLPSYIGKYTQPSFLYNVELKTFSIPLSNVSFNNLIDNISFIIEQKIGTKSLKIVFLPTNTAHFMETALAATSIAT